MLAKLSDGANSTTVEPADLWVPNLILKEPQDKIGAHIALYVFQVIALLAPPFKGRRGLFISILVGLAIQTQLHPHFTNDPGLAQPASISWSYYLATLEKFCFAEDGVPEKSLWRIDKPSQEAMMLQSFGLSKLRWAVSLMLNQRGVRWNFQVKNVHPSHYSADTKKQPGTIRFIVSQLIELIYSLTIADFFFQLCLRIIWTPGEHVLPGQVNSKYVTLRHSDPFWQLFKCFVFGAIPYYMLKTQYLLLSIIGTAVGLTQPADWPPLFGRLRDVTTVRKFWGKYWHQQLRSFLNKYSQKLTDVLGIPRGTTASSQFQVWVAFLLSGTFHALSQKVMPSPENILTSDLVRGFFLFFVWQAIAITCEDLIQHVWKRAFGFNRPAFESLYTLIGYVWVTFVLWYSLPYVGDTFLQMRFGSETLLPFTIWQSVVRQYIPIPEFQINV